MKRLILMRHAKSSWAIPEQDDFDRPLNKRGRRSAGLIGQWLSTSQEYIPELALVSSSRRTRETFDGVVNHTGHIEAKFKRSLYDASLDTLLSALRSATDDVQTLMIIAHQPAVGALATSLLQTPPDNAEFRRYPTAATSVIELPIKRWKGVATGHGSLADFVLARALE